MRDIAFAVSSAERHGDAPGAERHVALARGRKHLPQGPIGPCLAGDQTPADETENVAFSEKRVAGGIGVNQAPVRINQIHAGAEPIERVDEGCDLRRLELEHPADQYRAPDMRRDQPHLPARLVVDDPDSLVPEHAEYRRTDRRSLDDGTEEIGQALRLGPL